MDDDLTAQCNTFKPKGKLKRVERIPQDITTQEKGFEV